MSAEQYQPSIEEKNIDYAQYKSLSENLYQPKNKEQHTTWIQLDEECLRYLSEK